MAHDDSGTTILYGALIAATFISVWIGFNTSKLAIPIALADEFPNTKKRLEYYTFNSRKALVKGYSKFKDRVFALATNGGVNYVIPREFLDHLKSHKALSFSATLEEASTLSATILNHTLKEFKIAQKKYTCVGGLPDFGIKLMTGKLNPTLTAYIPIIHNIIRENWPEDVGKEDDWTPIKLYPLLLRLVTQISGRVFHSSEASKKEEWIQLGTVYVSEVIPYVQKLKMWPEFLRPFVWRSIPGYKSLNDQRTSAKKMIAETLRKKKESGEEYLENPPSMLDYLSSGKHADLIDDVEQQFFLQMTLIVASVHTSASTTTQSLFDLAFYREYLPELRDEVRSVLADCGGVFTRSGLAQLRKMDSFIKEVQRFNSPDLTTFQRIALSPITLPDGLRVPKGTKLELATGAINLDDAVWPDAKRFDGLRFHRMRQASREAESKHQFISVSKDELAWGYGRHACPGRWLADIVIKLILAEFLLRCDIKNPDGRGRWESLELDGQILPNEEGEVLVKRL